MIAFGFIKKNSISIKMNRKEVIPRETAWLVFVKTCFPESYFGDNVHPLKRRASTCLIAITDLCCAIRGYLCVSCVFMNAVSAIVTHNCECSLFFS